MNSPELAGLLHDLNNVFQNLIGAADLLSEDPHWQPVSAAILRSVECGRHVTQSLESSAGSRVTFETVLGNATAFVEDAILVTRGPAIRFHCQVEPDIHLPGNWAWERVLVNLFLNAIHAMPAGGEIEVEARRRGSEIRIIVRDSGSGIPDEVLSHLFDSQAPIKDGAAHGIGLHVVRSIVQKDGGTVQAANRADGPGAEFTIALPLAARPAHA